MDNVWSLKLPASASALDAAIKAATARGIIPAHDQGQNMSVHAVTWVSVGRCRRLSKLCAFDRNTVSYQISQICLR